jgi:hypothetical protein
MIISDTSQISSANDLILNTTTSSRYPKLGADEYVIRVGQSISLVWNSEDITNINIVFYKGDARLLVTNKVTKDGPNKYSIYVDNSFFSPDFMPCRIRVEMKENSNVYSESPIFKVLRPIG